MGGRRELAVLLLDYEASAIDQVPLLLQMDEPKKALEKAIDSGDTNLAHSVLMQLQERGLRLPVCRDNAVT